MTLKEMANKYIDVFEKIHQLQSECWNLDDEGKKKFGNYDWITAIGLSPIKEENGKIYATGFGNVITIAECLQDLANKRQMELTCEFNGTNIIAKPNSKVNDILNDWDRKRIEKK